MPSFGHGTVSIKTPLALRNQRLNQSNQRENMSTPEGSQDAEIVTENIKPPVPTRAFDWIAYREGREEGHRGFGSTEAEAINDLLESEQ